MTRVLAGLAIGVALAASVASTPAAMRHRCPSLKHPLAQNTQSVLYLYVPDVKGCWKPSGIRRVIAKGDGDFVPADVSHPRVGGHFAAFTRIFHSALSDRLAVWVGDLKTGAAHSVPIEYTGDYFPDGASAATVTRLVLTRTGTAAWTSDSGEWPSGATALPFHVDAMTRRGRVWTISRAAGIDPRSLRLAGRTISWTVGGVRRTARLP